MLGFVTPYLQTGNCCVNGSVISNVFRSRVHVEIQRNRDSHQSLLFYDKLCRDKRFFALISLSARPLVMPHSATRSATG